MSCDKSVEKKEKEKGKNTAPIRGREIPSRRLRPHCCYRRGKLGTLP